MKLIILKNKKAMIISGIIFLIVAYFGIKYFFNSNNAQAPIVSVQVDTVREKTLPIEVHGIGTLVARSVEITPEVAGHVEKILFQDGTAVKQGTVLIQLDDAIYKAKSESANAKLNYSENNFKRMTLLGKQGAIAKQAIDQAESDLKEKKAEAKENEVTLNKMKLIAPFDGIVGKSKVNLGDYVTVAQSVVTVTDNKRLRIEYNIPEKYLPLLKLGQKVKVTAAAYPDKIFIGNVAFIAPTINSENRSVSIYAEIPNETNELAAGMFVNAVHLLGSEEQAIIIPARSLVPILDGEQVYKVVDGKAYAVTVMVGKRLEGNVQIIKGLSSGDVIITDGQLKVRNGAAVQVKNIIKE